MPIHVQWDREDPTIIRTTFVGAWQWTDYENAIDEILRLCEPVTHRVDMITDLTDAGDLPDGVATPHILRFRTNKPPTFGMLMVINPSLYTQTMIDTANFLTRSKSDPSIIAENLAHARDLIYQSRASDEAGNTSDST